MILEATDMTKKDKIKNLLIKTIIEAKSETSVAPVVQPIVVQKSQVKKKTSKEIMEEVPYKPQGVEIVDEGLAKVVSFDSRKKRSHTIKDDVMKWNNADLAFYTTGLYFEKYGEKWAATNVNVTMYMAYVKEALQKVIGFCDNIIVKDYLSFFFDNSSWSDHYRQSRKGELFLKDLKEKLPTEAFANQYDYKSSLNKYLEQMRQKGTIIINEDAMKNSYLLGMEKFVLEYGIILTTNWIIMKEKLSTKEAIINVARAMYNVCMKDGFDEVKKNTECFCPYPEWLIFKDFGLIINAVNKKINKEYGMNVVFSNKNKEINNGFDFFKQNGTGK